MNIQDRIISEYEKAYLAANGRGVKVIFEKRRFRFNGLSFISSEMLDMIEELNKRIPAKLP